MGKDSNRVWRQKADGTYGWVTVDGSHAAGLDYVPWDGYIAQLHKGERVLTQSQARVLDTIGIGAQLRGSGVTTEDLRQVTATAVNAMGTMNGSSGGSYQIVLKMDVNGKEFYRRTIDDFRAVAKSMPEVTNDR